MVTIDFEAYNKKGLASLLQKFEKAALPVKEVVADNKSKREAGFAVKTATLTFESGQTLVLKIKAGGSLYQAKLNGKVLAIKNYMKADTFTDEVLAYVKQNEPAYAKQKEKQLARVKVAVPKVKVASTSIAEQIQSFSTSLEEFKGQNEAVRVQLDALTTPIAAKLNTLGTLKNQLDAENAKSADLQKQLSELQGGIMESAGTASKEEIMRRYAGKGDTPQSIASDFADKIGGQERLIAEKKRLIAESQGDKHAKVRQYAEKDIAKAQKLIVTYKAMIATLTGKILEAAGSAPAEIDRLQIANDMMHGDGRHPKLKAAFVEGFNNSCSMDDAIAFIESFTDAELLALLKDEENIFEGVELKVEGKIARLPKGYFLKWINAPEETAILEAVNEFNAYQEANGKPGRAMILEDDGGLPLPTEDTPIVLDPAQSGAVDGTVYAAHDGRGSYAIHTEPTGWSAFQDTTAIMPFTYQPPIQTTLGSRGDCPRCGGDMEACGDDGCKSCTACGCTVNAEGMVMESAKPFGSGTTVKLKGHREEGDALAGKEGIILESVPTAQGPFYKVKVDELIYRGIAPGMILEANGEILAVDRSGYHDANDPDHVNDPDHENLGGNVKNCPWCGSDVSENRCCSCNRQYDMAVKDREAWIAANKPLPADDFPSQYE